MQARRDGDRSRGMAEKRTARPPTAALFLTQQHKHRRKENYACSESVQPHQATFLHRKHDSTASAAIARAQAEARPFRHRSGDQPELRDGFIQLRLGGKLAAARLVQPPLLLDHIKG